MLAFGLAHGDRFDYKAACRPLRPPDQAIEVRGLPARSARQCIEIKPANLYNMTTIYDVFRTCVEGIQNGCLIQRANRQDKEFHFQNWFKARLSQTEHLFDENGRNSYPDFPIVRQAEGYEIKGLAYPGRDMNYDCNSQVPCGIHNGRTIFYVFGRYPKEPDGDSYPVVDLILCHGDFLNANHDYVHKNKSVKGFGSYGDIMIRDRKMYVAPTPFGIADGLAHRFTLILPDSYADLPSDFIRVGSLVRTEAREMIVGYSFDLRSNQINSETVPNPNAGREHHFTAWRISGCNADPVTLRATAPDALLDLDDDE